ncbi:MAG: transcription-repair coupling factor, partial [Treponema sp.]|nr:transcription-repair coupling factor [Treponema sp.]
MNTLSFPAFLKKIAASRGVSACFAAFSGRQFPLEIDAAEGALGALLMASFYNIRPGTFFAVLPTENEAADLAADLEISGIPAALFPWWGAMPYREMAPLSAVFGERTKVLSALVSGSKVLPGGNRGIFVIPERAFLTPLPPPEYIKKLLITVKPGGSIDTVTLAETMVRYGYTRVPKVQLHGEFALRGEVLDLLMGGDEEAYRILFDFDRVESIKRFNPLDQSGQDRVEELIIRPLKEVVWTEDRIRVLGANLAAFEEFTENGKALLEDLETRRETGGEELLFPLAFEKPATILDYLDKDEGTVFYPDRERLENAQESLDREYQSLYRKICREKTVRPSDFREVPAPGRILLHFKDLARQVPRRLSFMTIKGGGEKEAVRLSVACDPPR